MKKYFMVTFLSLVFILGCKSVRNPADSGLSELKINDPKGFTDIIKNKQKSYTNLQVVGYSVQVYAFDDTTKKASSYCAYPGGIKVETPHDFLVESGTSESNNFAGLVVGNGQTAYEGVACQEISGGSKGTPEAQPATFKYELDLGTDPQGPKDQGNFSLIQFMDSSKSIEKVDGLIQQVQSSGSEQDKKDLLPILNQTKNFVSNFKGNMMIFAGEKGTVQYYKWEAGKSLIDVKIKSGFDRYCATVQYYCTYEKDGTTTEPSLCIAASSMEADPFKTDGVVCNKAEGGAVKIGVPLLWTSEFAQGGNGVMETGTEEVDVEITPEIK